MVTSIGKDDDKKKSDDEPVLDLTALGSNDDATEIDTGVTSGADDSDWDPINVDEDKSSNQCSGAGSATASTKSSPTATGTHPGWTTPVMAALPAPANHAAAIALFFREKAFWEFGRGFRLGDLRRMIRDYGYAADGSQNFPIGPHYKGGVFGADLNLPVTTDEQVGNPNFTACIDRKA